jgi:hypothetical protein
MAEHNAPLTPERLEKRRGFCEADVTLNGERARISGARNPFATVTDLKSHLSAEWSWEAVERIINESNGMFRS